MTYSITPYSHQRPASLSLDRPDVMIVKLDIVMINFHCTYPKATTMLLRRSHERGMDHSSSASIGANQAIILRNGERTMLVVGVVVVCLALALMFLVSPVW